MLSRATTNSPSSRMASPTETPMYLCLGLSPQISCRRVFISKAFPEPTLTCRTTLILALSVMTIFCPLRLSTTRRALDQISFPDREMLYRPVTPGLKLTEGCLRGPDTAFRSRTVNNMPYHIGSRTECFLPLATPGTEHLVGPQWRCRTRDCTRT